MSELEVRPLRLEGLLELRPKRFGDERGFFSEVWHEERFAEAGVAVTFVQDNYSLSTVAGVLRGLHFQLPPAAQDKLVRVSRGRIFDVAVDIRRSSPTFGQWEGLLLSAEEWNQLLVPKGFAHGFVALEPNTEVVYKVSAHYAQALERSIRFDDPAIGIEWPLAGEPLLSAKDAEAPLLTNVETGF